MSDSDINQAGKPDTQSATEKTSLVELRNGKVVFKQKSLSFEKLSETLQEIVKFREMLEQRIGDKAAPLTTISDEFRPVIVKLAHESDKTLTALAKHVLHELLPARDEDEENTPASNVLSLPVVEAAIKSILTRNNYGLDGGLGAGKLPAAVCVWRWEVKEEYRDWLPKSMREKAEVRLAERIQAKNDLKALFECLSQEERSSIIDPKGTNKAQRERSKANAENLHSTVDSPAETKTPQHSKKQEKSQSEEGQDEQPLSVFKKVIDPAKVAKEKEKLEKKTAKAEKEKREKDAQTKSRSLMANFFGKAKSIRSSPSRDASRSEAGPSTHHSDFEKTFKPFVLKKDAQLAPINSFTEIRNKTRKYSSMNKLENEIILIDDDDNTPNEDNDISYDSPPKDLQDLSARERLHSVLSSLPRSTLPHRPNSKQSHLRTYNPLSVRDIIARLSEAEIAGETFVVRSLLSKLSNRECFPAKVLIFADDLRPGYYGTWTRNSQVIGPRTPFARDLLVLDYSYDSGEEWEDEGNAEADDVVEDGDDEDGDASDADSDMDSWLVDDDDVDDLVSIDDPNAIPPPTNVPARPTKRKLEDGDAKLEKKRKVVVPLVPFAKGPCWESTVGQCEHGIFKTYQIQLFNDTPFPIDPFTFVSTQQDTRSNDLSSKPTFVVPPLLDRSAPLNLPAPSGPSPQVTSSSGLVAVKRTASAPKTSFPDAYIPLLLAKITSLQAVSITFLVEAIYQELRVHKVKKNAIEAKVKEIGEKCKEKKVWVVKSDNAVSQGSP